MNLSEERMLLELPAEIAVVMLLMLMFWLLSFLFGCCYLCELVISKDSEDNDGKG